MTDIPLPGDRGSADKHFTVLKNLVDRYQATESSVNYKEAALNDVDNTVSSTVLGYFSELDLIKVEKQGEYVPSEPLIEYHEADYNPASSAAEEVWEILNSYEILKEADYLLGRGEYETKELAEAVVSLEEELDDDDTGDVKRAIEILDLLSMLSFEESGSVADSDDVDSLAESEDKSPPGESKQIPDDFEIEDLPRRAGPERLREISKVMETGGTWVRDEIDEEDEVEMDKRYISGTLDYGEKLGFIDEYEDGYGLSEQGFELYYEDDDPETTENLYREAIRQFGPFTAIMDSLGQNSESYEEGGLVENNDVLQLFRTDYGLTETSSDTVKRAITTFFETLEAAGFGEVKEASGTLPTRFRLDDGVTITGIANEVVPIKEESAKPSEEAVDEGQRDDFEDGVESLAEETDESRSEKESDLEERIPEEPSSVGRESKFANEQEQQSQVGEKSFSAPRANIDISISIELSDLDTAELDAKIDIIERLINSK